MHGRSRSATSAPSYVATDNQIDRINERRKVQSELKERGINQPGDDASDAEIKSYGNPPHWINGLKSRIFHLWEREFYTMKKSRFTDSQIMDVLKQVENGLPVPDLCRGLGISTATFYNWRSKYGGMDVSMMTRMKELEAENTIRYGRSSKLESGSTSHFGPINRVNVIMNKDGKILTVYYGKK